MIWAGWCSKRLAWNSDIFFIPKAKLGLFSLAGKARRLDRSNKRIQRRIHGTGVQASRSSIRGNGIRETQKEAFSKACVDMDQKIVVSYYPKRPQPDLTLGLKHHMDPGTITLPLQDQVGGLHATRVNGKTWITVQPVEGAFVVNLGDHGHVSIYMLTLLFLPHFLFIHIY